MNRSAHRVATAVIPILIGLMGCRGTPAIVEGTAVPSPGISASPAIASTHTVTPSPSATFTPAPSPTPVPVVRFAVIGDYGRVGEPAQAVANLVDGWEPDFVITVGDNTYQSNFDDNIGQYYHQYISPYVGVLGEGAETNRFWPALGNHDWDAGIDRWTEFFSLPGNERYYEVEIAPVRLFALDADYREPDGITAESVQGQWLQERLSQSTACWNLVYFHIAPYTSGGYHGADPVMRWPFAAWGADGVLSGHEHIYERLLVEGIPYFVNGLGGGGIYKMGEPVPESMFRYNAGHGAQLVIASPTTITYAFYSIAGEKLDEYEQVGGCGP